MPVPLNMIERNFESEMPILPKHKKLGNVELIKLAELFSKIFGELFKDPPIVFHVENPNPK